MLKRQKRKRQFILWQGSFDRDSVVRIMDFFQDLIVICLCVSLFCIMLSKLMGVFGALLTPLDFKKVTADVLFILILVELFRLLVIYLEEHSIAVGVAVEVAIVSVLREVIVHSVFDLTWIQVVAVCGLLLVLGGLLMVCARTPHMDLSSAHFHQLSSASHSPAGEALQHDSKSMKG